MLALDTWCVCTETILMPRLPFRTLYKGSWSRPRIASHVSRVRSYHTHDPGMIESFAKSIRTDRRQRLGIGSRTAAFDAGRRHAKLDITDVLEVERARLRTAC